MRGRALILLAYVSGAAAQKAPLPHGRAPEGDAQKPSRRLELNLAGETDAAAGESRRNENIQFNLVDNNALKELNVRMGTTATLHEFEPDRGYFGAEFGNAPSATIHTPPQSRSGLHGSAYAAHRNSVFSARSFFQAGGVKPAHDNDYGFTLGAPVSRGGYGFVDAAQQKLRGSVNGNVLVPRPDERTALATDPAVRAILERWLAAYPRELPNRTDINPRALNTNAPQSINNDRASFRIDQQRGERERISLLYSFLSQHVDAFQLVAGQNPDTDTRSHRARATWARQLQPGALIELSAGFDRVGSLLVPEPNAVGPMVSVSGLETLGPQAIIPIDRAHNVFRYAAQARRDQGKHSWRLGGEVLRRQLNGRETDAHRGFFGFGADFGRDAITNFRLGAPTQYIISLGDIHRGFRNRETLLYAGDRWRAAANLTVSYGLRYQAIAAPREVNGRNEIPYGCDCNNAAPQFGLAWRALRGTVRVGYGLEYGEIYPVTFQQVRFTPPGNNKIVVTAPSIIDPLRNAPGAPRSNLYLLDPELATPFEHQYNASWETSIRGWHVQAGYVGSRSQKLLIMRYQNRAHPAPGIPLTTATINARRPDQRVADVRFVTNGSRGYFDAARISLVVPSWRGLSLDAAYWFSKAIDLGASYSNTAYDADSRQSRSQWEWESNRDMKGLSAFDQPHAFLWRASYSAPRRAGSWTLSVVNLVKTGMPFTVNSGSDGPGFGNVDGNGGDRPNLLDPSILGRTVGDPDTSRSRLPKSAFAFMQPADARGNLGRNTFRKGGIANVNAALARTWALRREARLTLRAESINLFNTPQFAEPGVDLVSPNFGQITNTLNDGRTFRFQLQLGF